MIIIENPPQQIKSTRMCRKLPPPDDNALLRPGNLRRPTQFDISGIYQQRKINGVKRTVKYAPYTYIITHTEAQNANRQKFADAHTSWQALAPETKQIYNEMAKGKKMTGYNLYIRYYMNDLI